MSIKHICPNNNRTKCQTHTNIQYNRAKEVVNDLPTQKTLVVDGIPIDFFKELITYIEEDLLAFIAHVFKDFILYKSFNKSKISLLSKSGNLT